MLLIYDALSKGKCEGGWLCPDNVIFASTSLN